MQGNTSEMNLSAVGAAPTGDEVVAYIQQNYPEVWQDCLKSVALQKMYVRLTEKLSVVDDDISKENEENEGD